MELPKARYELEFNHGAVYGDEEAAALADVLKNSAPSCGPRVKEFEQAFAAYCQAQYGLAVTSATAGLELAMIACDVGPGDEVITTPLSWVSTANAIAARGARVVFADVDPRTLNIDPAEVERKITPRTKAILPVHLYGQCADMDALNALAEEFRVPIIEDAAQAIGAAWGQRRAGSIGVLAAFSFYPTKNLNAFGEAGMVTTRDPDLAERMRRLRSHGSPQRYLHEEFGWNARMDAIQAAVLRVKLPHVEKWNQQRRERARTYDRLFVEAGFSGNTPPVALPHTLAPAYHVFHQYVLRAQRRDDLRRFLSQRQIATEVYYPIPLHLQPVFGFLGYREGDLPEAERAAKEVLAIPMFPELREEEQRWVVQSISDFYS